MCLDPREPMRVTIGVAMARPMSARVRRREAIAAVACSATAHTVLPWRRVEPVQQIQR